MSGAELWFSVIDGRIQRAGIDLFPIGYTHFVVIISALAAVRSGHLASDFMGLLVFLSFGEEAFFCLPSMFLLVSLGT